MLPERPKRVAVKEETEKKDEEEWPLKDVIFVEDVKSLPVGELRLSHTDNWLKCSIFGCTSLW